MPHAPEGAVRNQTKDGSPVIELAEGSKVLKRFLFICYPAAAVDRPVFMNEFEEVRRLRRGLIRGCAQVQCGEDIEAVVEIAVVPQSSYRQTRWVYSQRLVGTERARRLVGSFESYAGKSNFEAELESITGGQMFRILQYHDECVTTTRELVEETKKRPPGRATGKHTSSTMNVVAPPPSLGRKGKFWAGYTPSTHGNTRGFWGIRLMLD